MSTSVSPGETVRARRFEVVDDEDRVRVVVGDLSAPATGAYVPGVSLLDADGQERALLAVHETGVQLSLMLEGNEVVVLGAADDIAENTYPGASLVLCGHDGTPSLEWRVTADGVFRWSRDDT